MFRRDKYMWENMIVALFLKMSTSRALVILLPLLTQLEYVYRVLRAI